MTPVPKKDALRMIPSVDEVLAAAEIAALRARYANFPWTACVRQIIGRFRAGELGQSGATRDEVKETIIAGVGVRLDELKNGGLGVVINATGVILHTNLGRSVFGERAREAADEAMANYVDLEIDLDSGQRSGRGGTLNELVAMATGAEAAVVVNNNAAAVYLVVNSFSPPGRVVISRGELVEIGGSFRLPDILERAASEMIEVGTTNRTYIDDYAKVARKGDILMRAHRSNYDIQGFTHDTTVGDLVALARERECHVVYDLGSGSLFDFSAIGIEGEERVADVLGAGVDCVTMSGDKLIGGPQAGIIVGSADLIARLRQNPLRRAVRIDKVVIAAMQSVMRSYLFAEEPARDIPMLSMAIEPADKLRSRAEAIVGRLPDAVRKKLRAEVVDDDSAVGGGSFAVASVPSVAIALHCDDDHAASRLARRLRVGEIPILSRIKGAEVRLNLRTVLANQDELLVNQLEAALRS